MKEYLLSLSESLQSGGSGEFTIDLEKALDKLSQFALEAPADIFLKAVQAGVAGGAKTIELSFNSDAIEVAFQGLASRPVEAVGQALLPGGGGTNDPFVAELVVACRALLEQCRFSLSGAGFLEFFPGLEVERDPEHRQESDFKIKIERPKKGPLAHLFLERTRSDYKSFVGRVVYCPVPLTVNGHPIRPLLGTAAKIPRGAVRHMACYGAVKVEGTRAEWASPLISEKSEGESFVPVHSPMKRGEPWAEFWCVATHGRRDGVDLHEQPRLAQFVRYGVVCAERTLSPSLAGGRLAIHADRAEVDLSGLSLEPSWSDEELNEALKRLWTDCVGRVRSSLEQFPQPPAFLNEAIEVPRRKFSWSSLIVALVACVAGVFPLGVIYGLILGSELAIPAYVLTCCLFLAYGYKSGFKVHRAHNERVEQEAEKKEKLDKMKADYWKSVRPKFALRELVHKCRA